MRKGGNGWQGDPDIQVSVISGLIYNAAISLNQDLIKRSIYWDHTEKQQWNTTITGLYNDMVVISGCSLSEVSPYRVTDVDDIDKDTYSTEVCINKKDIYDVTIFMRRWSRRLAHGILSERRSCTTMSGNFSSYIKLVFFFKLGYKRTLFIYSTNAKAIYKIKRDLTTFVMTTH